MSKRSAVLCLAMAAAVAGGPVSAETMRWNIDFSATFAPDGGITPNPVSGNFTVMFDPARSFRNSKEGLTVNFLNAPTTMGTYYSYSAPEDQVRSFLAIGDLISGVNGLAGFTDDYIVSIYGFPDVQFPSNVEATNADVAGVTGAIHQNITVTSVPVPIPAPALLLISALAGISLIRRKGRRTS